MTRHTKINRFMKKFAIHLDNIHDKFEFSMELPEPNTNIIVPVSGGIDSALLFYLLNYISCEYELNLDIRPVTFMRDSFSLKYAQDVIDHVTQSLNLESRKIESVFISEPDVEKQVLQGMITIINQYPKHIIYMGLIKIQPEHALHVPTFSIPDESVYLKFPLRNLNKANVINLICKLNQQHLLKITHSCVYERECQKCNRCNEKRWALRENNLIQ